MTEPEGDNPEPTRWGCVVPFLDTDVKYAHGVEFGQLFERLKEADKIHEYITRANQDQVLLLLSRLGWTVETIKEHDENWFYIEANRGSELLGGEND